MNVPKLLSAGRGAVRGIATAM